LPRIDGIFKRGWKEENLLLFGFNIPVV